MTATNHAGHAAYTYTTARGWVIGEVRLTRSEALADMALMPPGEYAVRESVWLNGVIV